MRLGKDGAHAESLLQQRINIHCSRRGLLTQRSVSCPGQHSLCTTIRALSKIRHTQAKRDRAQGNSKLPYFVPRRPSAAYCGGMEKEIGSHREDKTKAGCVIASCFCLNGTPCFQNTSRVYLQPLLHNPCRYRNSPACSCSWALRRSA